MQQVLGIFLGALCSGGASFCLGTLLLRRLNLELERTEYVALAFVAGSACFSQLIFLLCAVSLARQSVFIGFALLAASAVISTRRPKTHSTFPALAKWWKWLFGGLFVSFALVYLVNALAPEMSADGAAYHLPFVTRYLRAHGFTRIDQNLYANLSQGVELLFLPAVSLGGHSAAALVHFLFLVDLPLLMISYGRRFGFPLAALAAAFLVFASPVLGWDGTAAYVDVAAGTLLFALFYMLKIWDERRETRLLVPIGILAGSSFSAKYSAAVGIAYALGFVTWRLWRARKPWLRPAVTIACIAGMFVLPWMIKNEVFSGNPFAPFANRFFPNPNVHVSFEQQYRLGLDHYHLQSWLAVPWELTVKGERLQGFFGPAFLLLPFALVSLRSREGRRLLLAGTVFALPWLLNAGTRFLIPALPPLTLAMTLALQSPAALLPAIALLHGFLSWYRTPFRYFDEYAPRLTQFPLRGALRLEPEDVYLARYSPGYRIDRMIEREVPRGQKVFSFEQIPAAWTSREILTAYTGARNEVLQDTLWTAFCPWMYPSRALSFQFAPQRLRRLRLIRTARSSGEMWSVSEFRVFAQGKPLLADEKWHMTANPNPWEVPLAFDDRLVTRWRSWEGGKPGMYIELDFGKAVTIDDAWMVTAPDAFETQVELRGMDSDGEWCTLSARRSVLTLPIPGNIRREAVRALVARGVHYLLVSPSAFGASDFSNYSNKWGIRLVGESNRTRLYWLNPDDAAGSADEPAAARQTSVPPGRYDDPDPRISLNAAWTTDPQFPDAENHTITYSNIPGASASLAFRGSSITYIYTRAPNRGIADVFIDGRLQDRTDLYFPAVLWRSQTKYGNLGAGEHVMEIRVTGERNPRAKDCFVDLDGFVVE